MNTYLKPGIFILFILASFTCCKKENPKANNEPDCSYYPSEIISHQYAAIYGRWELDKISGGFTGIGYVPDFQILEINPFGKYNILRNDSILEFGKIEVDLQDSQELFITLVPDAASKQIIIYDAEKSVQMTGCDSLNLVAPCCDRLNYHFVRIR